MHSAAMRLSHQRAELFAVLHAGLEVAPERRQRFWRGIGQAFALRGLVLVPVIDDAAKQAVRIRLFSPDGRSLDSRPLAAVSWEPSEPYRIIPRALAFDAGGRVHRVLFEVQFVGEGRPCWASSSMHGGTPCTPPSPGDGCSIAT